MSVSVPPVVTKAFGFGADPAFITIPIPVTPPGDPRASYTLGFPPVTFAPEVSGGLPPDGRDVNGILNTVTAHCAYINAGQPYVFDAAVPASITGYGVGAQLGMSDGSGFWFNLSANNAINPDTTGTGWVPSYSYGFTSISGLTGGSVTLTVAQHRRNTIVLSGTLTSNLQLIFPTQLREWRLVNQCTGSFTVTAKTAAGTGVVIPSGSFGSPVSVYGDGTNLYPTVAPFVLPLSVAPVANTIVQRDASAFVYATRFNSSIPPENLTIGSIVFEDFTGDGFFRKIGLGNFQTQLNVGAFGGALVNGQVPVGVVTQHAAALFTNAALTGNPTAPTASPGDNDTSIATTAFVQNAKTKTAGISMTSAGATVNAYNATGTRTGVGTYSINVSGAGFTTNPIAVGNLSPNPGADTAIVETFAVSPTSIGVVILRASNGTAIDRNFNVTVVGS